MKQFKLDIECASESKEKNLIIVDKKSIDSDILIDYYCDTYDLNVLNDAQVKYYVSFAFNIVLHVIDIINSGLCKYKDFYKVQQLILQYLKNLYQYTDDIFYSFRIEKITFEMKVPFSFTCVLDLTNANVEIDEMTDFIFDSMNEKKIFCNPSIETLFVPNLNSLKHIKQGKRYKIKLDIMQEISNIYNVGQIAAQVYGFNFNHHNSIIDFIEKTDDYNRLVYRTGLEMSYVAFVNYLLIYNAIANINKLRVNKLPEDVLQSVYWSTAIKEILSSAYETHVFVYNNIDQKQLELRAYKTHKVIPPELKTQCLYAPIILYKIYELSIFSNSENDYIDLSQYTRHMRNLYEFHHCIDTIMRNQKEDKNEN